MSAGERAAKAPSDKEVDKLVSDPRVAKLLARKPIINRNYDLPYLAGYSRDGRTIYLDRHLPAAGIKVGGKIVNVVPYLLVHETVEKALIDVFGMKYQPAHEAAEVMEHRKWSAENPKVDPEVYEKGLVPYVKEDQMEKIKKVPPDYDLTPYIDSAAVKLLAHIRSVMNKNDWKRAVAGRRIS